MRALLLLAFLPSLALAQVRPPTSSVSASGVSTQPLTAPGVTSAGAIQTKGLVSTALSTPVNGTFAATSGTLNNGTYYYQVTALDAAGETLPSTETSITVSGGAASNGVIVKWGAVTGATSYKVYGRSTGAELLMATVTAPTVTWTDNGSVTPSGAKPTLGTSANISTVSGVTARDVTTTAASGAVAMSGTNGAKFCPGATSACLTSDGTTITGGYLNVANQLSVSLIRQYGGTANPLYFKSLTSDGADAEMFSFSRMYASSPVAGSRIVGFYPDTGSTRVASVTVEGTYSMDGTDASGTPGAVTINKPLMIVAVDDTASSVVVTDSIVTATTPVFCQAQQVDATCTQVVSTVPAAGSFTINMNAACTAHTKVACLVHGMF